MTCWFALIHTGLAQDDVVVTITPSRFVAGLITNDSQLPQFANFTCTVTTTEAVQILVIFVNGVQEAKEWESMGIFTSRLSNTISTVSIAARAENNVSSIDCLAILTSPSRTIESESAILLIQGLLSSPSDLTTMAIASRPNFQRLTWQRPFTLDIDVVKSDIPVYRVCFNFSGSPVCTLTEDTSYEFLNIRLPLVFQVTAINVIGESEASLFLHDPCAWFEELTTLNVCIMLFPY